MLKSYLCWFVMMFFACQNGEQAQEAESNVRPLRKIPIENKEVADTLRQQGLDVIVVEDNYLVVRMHKSDSAKVRSLNLEMEPIREEDLVQRLVKIPIGEKSDANDLAGFGMDIWEVREDTVVAQVFDSQIFAAREKGYEVVIVARNVLDTVKKREK